ncbi:MAG: efflux RND transporter periplasmic adaptor subunit [Bacillota bacterium]|jgi:multidrug efflux pump subunit AcrA (membrane-fusion protein)
MKKWFEIVGIIVVIGGVALAFGNGWGCKRQTVKKKAASPRKTAAAAAATATSGVEAYGTIKAREYKDLNLEFPAQITKVPVRDGQRVKLGEALIYLNISSFQAQLKSKENELNTARFELLKQEKVLRDAQEAYAKARRNLLDKERLLREGALSRQEVDDYRDVVLVKEQAVTDIKLARDQSQGINRIGVLQEKVRVLEYDLARMRRKLDQSFLKGNVIVSDFQNAVVYGINCAAGYTVGMGDNQQQKLLSIMNLDSLYVSAEVAEEFIKDIKLGMAAVITPLADRKRQYHGKVIQIAAMAEKDNGETNVAVEVFLTDGDSFLRPNFNVDVEIAKQAEK